MQDKPQIKDDPLFQLLKKGKVKEFAFDKKGNRYKEHPVSKKVFKGFQIPMWSEVIDIAIEIQKKASEAGIPLRIGIHEGEIIVEGVDVFGDGVNVASRLQEYTGKGCISISGAVFRDIKNKPGIIAEFIEETLLKNVDEPVKIYQVYSKNDEIIKPSQKGSAQKTEASIAVLPFMNMSNDPEQEYFCDGISEEIINALTHIESLKVIARTSSFSFKGKNEDMREIGKKLNVETLLEGSVRKAGNRVRITAQLIKAKDGTHFWSERYDRELNDIFAIQDEISQAIVEKLKVQLIDRDKKVLFKGQTENLEAYDNYLKGRYYWNKMNIEAHPL